MRILIADDNAIVRRGIAELLRKETGWEVCAESSDGPDTLRKALDSRPDLILLDVQMPGVRGFDLARQLRRELPQTPLFLISHHDPRQLAAVAREAGATGCIDKARLATDLVSAIRALTW